MAHEDEVFAEVENVGYVDSVVRGVNRYSGGGDAYAVDYGDNAVWVNATCYICGPDCVHWLGSYLCPD